MLDINISTRKLCPSNSFAHQIMNDQNNNIANLLDQHPKREIQYAENIKTNLWDSFLCTLYILFVIQKPCQIAHI